MTAPATHPPSGPSTPPPPSGPKQALAIVAPTLLAQADAILAGLKTPAGGDALQGWGARRRPAETPARRDPMDARSQESDAVATTGGPAHFSLPPISTVPSFDNGPATSCRCLHCTSRQP